MSPLVPIVMYGWIPVVIYLFSRFPAQRAVIISFIIAWSFLPQAEYTFSGIPDYTKMSATCYGILLATVIFDLKRLSSFRPSWLDLPMLVWCLVPLASSLSNGLGLYDGLSSSLSQTVIWGTPYFLGRIYLNNLSGLRQLATGIFLGGLLYVPLCLYEARMSPQLHRMLYGFHARGFVMTIRLGGYRPTVFMRHGLTVAMWMMSATLIGIVLWRSGVIQKMWGIPMPWLIGALFITFILCRSTGAYFYLVFGLVVFFVAQQFRSAFPLLLLIGAISIYLYLGASGIFANNFADQVVTQMAQITNEVRASSLEFRFDNEKVLAEKARQRMILGWGGWGRNRVYDDKGRSTTTDSLWIIAFGKNGVVGLISVMSCFLVPVVAFCLLAYPGNVWLHPKVAPVVALAVILVLYAIDCTLNHQPNPVYTVIAGGLSGLVTTKIRSKAVKSPNRLRSRSMHPLQSKRILQK